MRPRKKKGIPKLNLIPILDAIFIFIFFLLMSAQFIDIYEINSDAPISTSTETLKKDEKPLNLTLVLKNNRITVTKGLENIKVKSFKITEMEKLNETLMELKKQHPKETSAILKPTKSFPYHKIVKVIDYTREIRKKDVLITAVNNQNKKYQTNKLFDQIIFETMD
jgi:biopolymer transport protein ExbD